MWLTGNPVTLAMRASTARTVLSAAQRPVHQELLDERVSRALEVACQPVLTAAGLPAAAAAAAGVAALAALGALLWVRPAEDAADVHETVDRVSALIESVPLRRCPSRPPVRAAFCSGAAAAWLAPTGWQPGPLDHISQELPATHGKLRQKGSRGRGDTTVEISESTVSTSTAFGFFPSNKVVSALKNGLARNSMRIVFTFFQCSHNIIEEHRAAS
eukprot:COSAG04_NODE_569_length_12540_cov_7.635238_3_plen_216_part_00